jgi:mercuric ion binding protein
MFRTIVITAAIAVTPLAAFATTMTAGISGLVCAFCAQSLEKVFKQQPEVADIKVDLDSATMKLTFKDGKSLSEDKVKKLVLDAGYVVTETKVEK